MGWDGLTGLKRLHLRRNKIEKVDDELPALESLEYLNLRANKMSSMEQVEKLFKNPNLKDLSVLNNTIEQNMSSFEVLVADTLSKNPKQFGSNGYPKPIRAEDQWIFLRNP